MHLNGKKPALTDEQFKALNSKKVFFGHQSVGDNIMDGIRDLMASDPRLKLTIVQSGDPHLTTGAAFVESHIGENRRPETKTKAFAAVIDKGMGQQGGIALFKYCYIDFNSTTNERAVFENYSEQIAVLKQKYPALKIVHVTVPLTTQESTPTAKTRLKSAVKRMLGRDANMKRNSFNTLLKKTYANDPIFDLAEIESMRPDGSRSAFSQRRCKVYTLAPEFTSDGGHLNESGRRVAAEELLRLLASV